jgi:hypothetical protein
MELSRNYKVSHKFGRLIWFIVSGPFLLNFFFPISPSNNSIFFFFYLVFFSISSLNIMMSRNWASTCFIWSYSCLMDLVFFSRFQPSVLNLLEIEFCKFFMKLSRSHDSNREFNRLALVDLSCFFIRGLHNFFLLFIKLSRSHD